LLRVALPKVSRALGTNIHIRDFSLQLSHAAPSLRIQNIVVDGVSPAQSPLFEADQLEIGLQIVSLLKREWHFDNVTMDHPVLRLDVDQAGNINLPQRGAPNDSSIFDLGIRNVLLRQGELYYNDQKVPLDAWLRDVALQSRFESKSKKYSGRVSYQNGQIRFRDWNPIVHKLDSEFEATPETLIIKDCTLSTGASQFKIEATVNNFTHPEANGTYQASLDSNDIAQMLHGLPIFSGVVGLVGSAHFQSGSNETVLQALHLEGNVNSSSLRVHAAAIDTELGDVSAEYLLHDGDIDIRNLRARVVGGTLIGAYAIHDLAATRHSDLHAVLSNVNLSSLQAILHPAIRKPFRLDGSANVTLQANWKQVSEALVAQASADLKGSVTPVESQGGSFHAFPLEARLRLAYSAPAAEITFTPSYLRTPKTTVTLSGTISRRQSLQVQVHSGELHELEIVANAFGVIREPIDLYGNASFKGTVRGSTSQPEIAGHLSSPALEIRGTQWQLLQVTLDASPSYLALRNGEVHGADNAGRLTFDATVGLDRWSYVGSHPFEINLNAARLNISPLMILADVKAPVAGTVSAQVSLHGSQDNIVGQGTVYLNQVTVLHETVSSLTASFRGDGDSLRAHLNSDFATGSVQGELIYFPRRKAFDGQLQATNVNLDQLQTFRMKGIRAAGVVNMTLKGGGPLDDPSLDLTAKVSRPQIDNYRFGDLSLAGNIAKRVAHIAFDSRAPNPLHGHAEVQLTGDYFARATVDLASIPLAPLLAMYLPAQVADLAGQTELHAVVNGPLKNPSAMTGQINLPTLSFAYRDLEFVNTQLIRLEYRSGVLTLAKTAIQGTGGNLQLQGTFPLVGTGSIALNLTGDIDLKLVSIINPDYAGSGQLEFNINGYGSRTNPNFQGQIKVVDAGLSGSGIPVALQNGNGVLTLLDDRLDIDRFQGNLSNGTFSARGTLTYRPVIRLNLTMTATGVRTLYPPGVRGNVDANLSLTGPVQSPLLKGEVYLNEVSFSQAFSLDDLLDKSARLGRTLSAASGKVNLDLTVQSVNELNPATEQLTLRGAVNLRVHGTAGQPALWGTIRLSGGELLFRGSRFILKPSTVEFVDPSGIKPSVNIAVETRVKQYNIRMLLLGPLDELRTTFSSDPPLPSADAINLLIFGQTNQPITMEAAGNLGAVSLLASEVTGTLTNRLQKIVGISQLSIDPVLDNNGPGSTVGVSVQQRVNANLFVTFTSDPSSTERQVVEVEYHATPTITLIGVVNKNGGFATDVRIRKTW
jgi:translocation and assembly module TamB